MPRGSDLHDEPHHHKNTEAVRHLSHSQLEILTLASLFHETGGDLNDDGGKSTTWANQSGWNKILEVATALKNGGTPIPKTSTMQSSFPSVFGVKWERNHVVSIDLSGNGLSGTFPADIIRLRFLTILKLRNNPNLRGMLPQGIYSMPHLKYCCVDGTTIENTLPYNMAHSFQITRFKPETGRSFRTPVATVSFCTGDEHTDKVIHWMTDMTETEMYKVHSTLKKLHENASGQKVREMIKCTASNATGPERAASAIKLQRIYRARVKRTKFRNFLRSLIEMKVDSDTGYTYYVNSRTGKATWEKPKFLTSDTTKIATQSDNSSDNVSSARAAWKSYDDGYGNTYYWNSVTGESTWEPPSFLSRIYEELRERYGTAQTDEERFELFFQDIDRDGTGAIDQDEFARLCGDLGMALSAKQIQEVFRELDTTGDGHLDRPEIIAWLTRNFQ